MRTKGKLVSFFFFLRVKSMHKIGFVFVYFCPLFFFFPRCLCVLFFSYFFTVGGLPIRCRIFFSLSLTFFFFLLFCASDYVIYTQCCYSQLPSLSVVAVVVFFFLLSLRYIVSFPLLVLLSQHATLTHTHTHMHPCACIADKQIKKKKERKDPVP